MDPRQLLECRVKEGFRVMEEEATEVVTALWSFDPCRSLLSRVMPSCGLQDSFRIVLLLQWLPMVLIRYTMYSRLKKSPAEDRRVLIATVHMHIEVVARPELLALLNVVANRTSTHSNGAMPLYASKSARQHTSALFPQPQLDTSDKTAEAQMCARLVTFVRSIEQVDRVLVHLCSLSLLRSKASSSCFRQHHEGSMRGSTHKVVVPVADAGLDSALPLPPVLPAGMKKTDRQLFAMLAAVGAVSQAKWHRWFDVDRFELLILPPYSVATPATPATSAVGASAGAETTSVPAPPYVAASKDVAGAAGAPVSPKIIFAPAPIFYSGNQHVQLATDAGKPQEQLATNPNNPPEQATAATGNHKSPPKPFYVEPGILADILAGCAEWADVQLSHGVFVKFLSRSWDVAVGPRSQPASTSTAKSSRRDNASEGKRSHTRTTQWLKGHPLCILRVSLDAPNLVIFYYAFFATPPPYRTAVQNRIREHVVAKVDESVADSVSTRLPSSRLRFLGVFLSRLLVQADEGATTRADDNICGLCAPCAVDAKATDEKHCPMDGGATLRQDGADTDSIAEADDPVTESLCCGGTRVPSSLLVTMWRRRYAVLFHTVCSVRCFKQVCVSRCVLLSPQLGVDVPHHQRPERSFPTAARESLVCGIHRHELAA